MCILFVWPCVDEVAAVQGEERRIAFGFCVVGFRGKIVGHSCWVEALEDGCINATYLSFGILRKMWGRKGGDEEVGRYTRGPEKED